MSAEATKKTRKPAAKKTLTSKVEQKVKTASSTPFKRPRTKKATAAPVDPGNPQGYKHVVKSEIWDQNREVLRSIGATDAQIESLYNRKFAALPLWARKRIKRQLRTAQRGMLRSKGTELREVKSYFFHPLSRDEWSKLEAQFPARKFRPVLVRDEETNRLMRV